MFNVSLFQFSKRFHRKSEQIHKYWKSTSLQKKKKIGKLTAAFLVNIVCSTECIFFFKLNNFISKMGKFSYKWFRFLMDSCLQNRIDIFRVYTVKNMCGFLLAGTKTIGSKSIWKKRTSTAHELKWKRPLRAISQPKLCNGIKIMAQLLVVRYSFFFASSNPIHLDKHSSRYTPTPYRVVFHTYIASVVLASLQ